MLKTHENERITRVGPGTPMGNLFRRYWLPALLSEEIVEPDGAPVRVRLLGENLVAFRGTDGAVGLMDAYCPHRLAPMFFGRNEEHGLRCVYHGWKFDRAGRCTDMPSEPPDSLFKNKVTIRTYPTHEAGGVIWAYLGTPEQQPPLPDYEWLRAPATHRRVSKTFEHCNWLQGLEGGIDTAHSSFAHNERLGDVTWIRNRDGHPRLEVEKTAYGFRYTSTRDMGPDVGNYVRLYHFMMPAMQLRGGVNSWTGYGRDTVPRLDGHIWMPTDDETTYVYNFLWTLDANWPIDDAWYWKDEARFGRGKDDLLPGYKLKRNPSNDYLIDRALQRTKNYTGIVGINTVDYALQEGMGSIVDRSREHLGTSDKAIIAARQLLLEGTDEVERGNAPRGLDPAAYRAIRPFDAVIAHGRDWREAFADDLIAKW